MIFKRTVTKKEKRQAARKRLFLLLIFVGLISINIVFFYKAFIEKPRPIINPLSKNQIYSTTLIEKRLKEERIDYRSLSTQKDLSYLIKMKDGGEVIIDSSKNIDQQISSLQLILSQLKIEGKMLRRLDYRFDKPTITF